LATLLATTQSDASPETINALETDTSYFSNTALATETPLQPPVPESVPEPTPKAASHDLDFDLDGMMQEVEVPNTIQRPVAAEPSADMASIDFDFLDEPNITQAPAPQEPVSAPAGLDEPALTDDLPSLEDVPAPASNEVPPMEFDVSAPAEAAVDPVQARAADPLDFDLSDISLELSPPENRAEPDSAIPRLSDEPSGSASLPSSDAEMATKLDLAVAYQEIGDKEGARELLDEVLKGGSSEQSERAKALLHELA
jgi:pilus assembly protein FimV